MVESSLLQHVFGPEETLSGTLSNTQKTEQTLALTLEFTSAFTATPDMSTTAAIREVGDRDDDTIRGTGDDDVLLGLAGDDFLVGRAAMTR